MFVPRRSSWISSSPYHPGRQTVRKRSTTSPVVPKVISIPVRFVGSDESPAAVAMACMDPEVATVKLQKTARGFLVRKNVKLVRGIEAEVGKMEEKIKGEEELVWKEKEWLRVSEMLMGVLFKLDSVRGVREYRKKVVRRAVLLQEALDSIAIADSGKVEVGPREKTMDTMEEPQDGKERARSNLDSNEAGDASSGENEENHATAIKSGAPAETLEVDRNKEDAMMQEEATTVDDGVGIGEGAMNQRTNALAADLPETSAAVRR